MRRRVRRFAVVGTVVGAGILVARARLPVLHERLMARCEGMFDRMPDSFPPKSAMCGIEEIRANTGRILEMLESRNDGARATSGSLSAEAVNHVP